MPIDHREVKEFREENHLTFERRIDSSLISVISLCSSIKKNGRAVRPWRVQEVRVRND